MAISRTKKLTRNQISYFKHVNTFGHFRATVRCQSMTINSSMSPRDTQYIPQAVYQKLSAFTFFRIQFTLHASIIHRYASTLLGYFVHLILYSVWLVNDDPRPIPCHTLTFH